jgi:hypothetical protein
LATSRLIRVELNAKIMTAISDKYIYSEGTVAVQVISIASSQNPFFFLYWTVEIDTREDQSWADRDKESE